MPSFYDLEIIDRTQETSDCVSIAFGIPPDLRETFRYRAGQYLTLRTTIQGEDVRRSYSLCSAPHENEWRVAIKRVPDGKFSTYANDKLQVGDILQVMPPTGGFKAPVDPVNLVVGFAAGSGITPVFGIAKQVLTENQQARFVLIYGNRFTKDVIFLEAIEALKNTYLERFSVYHVLSREHLGTDLFYGRIDEEKCTAFAKTLFPATAVDDYFLCGPEPMIHAITDSLTAAGVAKKQIHFELFGAPQAGAKSTTPVRNIQRQADLSKVQITFEDKTTTIDMLDDGNHLLEAALAYGMDLPYACKGGVCSTCKCKVLHGEVHMDINYALEPDEVEAGFVLSCQARPITEEVAVSFDV